LSTVNIGSTPGAALTWDTSPFSWDSPTAQKTWADATAGYDYNADVAEDVVQLSEKQPKSGTTLKREVCSVTETHFDVVDFVRTLAEAYSIAELIKRTLTKKLNYEGTTILSEGNRWTQATPYIYNNYHVPATLTQLTDETYNGNPIFRLSMTPTAAYLASFQTSLFAHGIYGGYMFYTAGAHYYSSVIWRPVSHPVNVGNQASNIVGWGATTTVDLGDGWNKSYDTWYHATAQKSDQKFFSFDCPTLVLGETVTMDFTCPEVFPVMSNPSKELLLATNHPEGDTFAMTDYRTSDVTRINNENLGIVEVLSDVAAFFRTLTEVLHQIDGCTDNVDFFRDYNDNLSVSDTRSGSISIGLLDEILTVTQSIYSNAVISKTSEAANIMGQLHHIVSQDVRTRRAC
jgi:hypothetical protein